MHRYALLEHYNKDKIMAQFKVPLHHLGYGVDLQFHHQKRDPVQEKAYHNMHLAKVQNILK